MAVPTGRQLTPSYARRYSNTAHAPHVGFSGGIIRDTASWEAPEGSVYDAADMLCDKFGKIRKRGGTTSPSTINLPAYSENLVAFKSSGYDQLALLMGSTAANPGNIYIFNTSTGVATTLASSLSGFGFTQSGVVGRPFQHSNYMAFPFQPTGLSANAPQGVILSGGSKGGHTLSAAATISAGDNRITAIGAPSVGAVLSTHVGAFVVATNATNQYRGRVVAYVSATSVRVEPTPTIGFAATTFELYDLHPMYSTSAGGISGAFGVSYEGRMVLGSTLEGLPTTVASGTDFKRNRLAWSQLTTEKANNPAAGGGPATYDGDPMLLDAQPFLGSSPLYYNYTDIPNLEGMTGLAVAGEGQLIVFGPRKVFRIDGNLSTETAANPDFSFTTLQIAANVGILAPRTGSVGDTPSHSIQYTRNGLIFCGADNLYLYDGSRVQSLLDNHNSDYLQRRLRSGDAIYGSAYALNLNHYYLSMGGSDGGLMFDLDTMAMTRMTGPTTQLFDAVPDPTDATILWGARWWDITGAAPTMTKGQLVRLDPIWLPTSTNKSDGDGTGVLPTLRTKSYLEGDPAATKRFTQAGFEYDLRDAANTATATVSADTKLNASDASYLTGATPWSLTRTQTAAAEKAFWMLPTLAKGPAIEFQIVLNAICDSFELNALTVGVQDQRVGR